MIKVSKGVDTLESHLQVLDIPRFAPDMVLSNPKPAEDSRYHLGHSSNIAFDSHSILYCTWICPLKHVFEGQQAYALSALQGHTCAYR